MTGTELRLRPVREARGFETWLGVLIGFALWSTSALAQTVPRVPPRIIAVVNAAGSAAKVARGSVATIVGTDFRSGVPAVASTIPLPTALEGVSVTVGGVAAPLFSVSGTQINFQVPFEVPAGGRASVIVTNGGIASAPFDVATADYAVGVFTYDGTGQAQEPIILHESTNELVTASNPGQPNEIVVAYATGIGRLSTPPRTGAAAEGGTTAVDTPAVTVGGAPGTVLFAGLTEGFVGLAQFNIRLPATLATGTVSLVISFPGDASAAVNLPVQAAAQGAPKLALSTNGVAFGNVNVGESRDMSLTIANTGTATLTIDSLAVSGLGFSLVSSAGPSAVPPGGQETATMRFEAASTGPQSGTLTIASNDPGKPSATVALRADGAPAGSTLSLFVASEGADWSDYTPDGGGITIDYTSYFLSLITPSVKRWSVVQKHVVPNYAVSTYRVFVQDSQVYEATLAVGSAEDNSLTDCVFRKLDPATRNMLGMIRFGSSCTTEILEHVGFVGDSIYYRVPSYNWWGRYYGGQFKVTTASSSRTLLDRTDADNQAYVDAADHGTLYAIYFYTNGALKIWTRNLTTGRLETLVRSFSALNREAFERFSFKISDGVLYIAVTRKSDQAFQIWATDLSGPAASATAPQLLEVYPASSVGSRGLWHVDHGKVAFVFRSSTVTNGIAVLDVGANATQYYDLGKTRIYDAAPLWIPDH